MREHRRNLHKIPEPGLKEFKTTRYLEQVLSRLPGWELDKPLKTGLIAFKKGQVGSKTVAFRADIDALPITEQTGVPFASQHQGYMHACGHDMHMAVLLGLAEYLCQRPADEHVLLIFQPAEEGPGGAEALVRTGLLERYCVDEIYALHVSPEYPVGTVASRPGVLFANTSELFIELRGTGGHAAYPHLANDMVVAGSHLALQLHSIVSRNIDPNHSAVLTIGELNAGTRQNVVADHARLTGTIRTLSAEDMQLIKNRVESIVNGIAASFALETKLDYGANYAAVDNDHRIVKAFVERLSSLPDINYVECQAAMVGEDFGYFLQEVPGMLFWLGVSNTGRPMKNGLHTPKFCPDERALDIGLKIFASLLTYAE